MNGLILKTISPLIATVTFLFSFWVLFTGHNVPGGGFIAGLLGASAFAVYLMAYPRKLIKKLSYPYLIFGIALGLGLTLLSGLIAFFVHKPFLTAIWFNFSLGSPLLFDIGVYLIVLNSVLLMMMVLQEANQ